MCKESVQRSAQSRNDIILNDGLYLNIYLYIYGENVSHTNCWFCFQYLRISTGKILKITGSCTSWKQTTAIPSCPSVERDITLTLTAFPRAVQEIECPFHPLPVLEVEKGVGDSFAVASLQDVLWRQDQALRLQKVLEQMRRNSDCSAGPLGFICQV